MLRRGGARVWPRCAGSRITVWGSEEDVPACVPRVGKAPGFRLPGRERLPGCARRTAEGGYPHMATVGKLGTGLLLLGGEITLAGADLQVFLEGGDFDGAVAAVGIEVGRLIADDVLAAEFVLDGGEGTGDVLHLERKEGAAAGGLGQLLENFVAAQDQAAVVGGDGIDDDFGALRHLNGLRARVFALVILAIAHKHNRLARGMIGMIL